jgi:hypothetical protein
MASRDGRDGALSEFLFCPQPVFEFVTGFAAACEKEIVRTMCDVRLGDVDRPARPETRSAIGGRSGAIGGLSLCGFCHLDYLARFARRDDGAKSVRLPLGEKRRRCGCCCGRRSNAGLECRPYARSESTEFVAFIENLRPG